MRILVACDGSDIGESAAAAIAPWAVAAKAAIDLIIIVDPDDPHGQVNAKNSSSLFLGPATLQGRVMPSAGRGTSAARSSKELLPEDNDYVAGTRVHDDAENRGQALERARNEHYDYLRAVAEQYLKGAETEAHVEFSDNTAEAIAEQAQALGADLIALGSHGRSGISRAIMGSVAEKLVREAPVPVLVIGPAVRERMATVHSTA